LNDDHDLSKGDYACFLNIIVNQYIYSCLAIMMYVFNLCDIEKCGKGKILNTMALLQLGVELLLGSFHNLQVVTLVTI
jgi:hypothetical protein